MTQLSHVAVAAALVAACIAAPTAQAVTKPDAPIRGRIVAQSVTEPWMAGPVDTQAAWGDRLFLATSRPCVGDRHYGDVRVVQARPENPAMQEFADFWKANSPWSASRHNVRELANIAVLQPPIIGTPMAPPAVPGQYTIEIDCVAAQNGRVLATFVGDITVVDRALVDVSAARSIAKRPVTVSLARQLYGPDPATANLTHVSLAPPFDTYPAGIDLVMSAGNDTLTEYRNGAWSKHSNYLDAPSRLPNSANNTVRVAVSPTTLPTLRKPMFKAFTETHRVNPQDIFEGVGCTSNPTFDLHRETDGRLGLRLVGVSTGWVGRIHGVPAGSTGQTRTVDITNDFRGPLLLGTVANGSSLELPLSFVASDQMNSSCNSYHHLALSDADDSAASHILTLPPPTISGSISPRDMWHLPPEWELTIQQEIPGQVQPTHCAVTSNSLFSSPMKCSHPGGCGVNYQGTGWGLDPSPFMITARDANGDMYYGPIQYVDMGKIVPGWNDVPEWFQP